MRAEALKRVKKASGPLWSRRPLAILVDQKTTSVSPKNNNGSPQKSKKGFWSKWSRTPIVYTTKVASGKFRPENILIEVTEQQHLPF